jgi:hypothetical protein
MLFPSAFFVAGISAYTVVIPGIGAFGGIGPVHVFTVTVLIALLIASLFIIFLFFIVPVSALVGSVVRLGHRVLLKYIP